MAKTATGARDAAAALAVEARCTSTIRAAIVARTEAGEIEDLRAELAEIKSRLAGKKGSAQRADVATTPPLARGARTLQ